MAESSIENVADLLFRDLQYLKASSVERCVTDVAGYRGVAEADISSSVEQNLRMAIQAVKSGTVPESSQLTLEARVAPVIYRILFNHESAPELRVQDRISRLLRPGTATDLRD